MRLNRRTFLQKAGLGWLAIAASQSGFWYWADRYSQTLAEPTPRKLALLVGINEYSDGTNLKGCLTDVELQRELLVHRFGFKPQDILTLTGEQATREAIERSFVEHLAEQAKPGDVVLFHFSGYGRQVKLPPANGSESLNYRLVNSLMPSDSILPTKATPVANDLLEETLLLMGRSLATDKLSFVLDSSYGSTGRLLQGNLRVRSFPTIGEKLNPELLAWQEQLQRQLNTAAPTWKRPVTGLSGTMLAAASGERVATEIAIDGLNAGLFTHTLTQYLWQVTPASRVVVAMNRTAEQMAVAMGVHQEPQQMSGDKQPLLTYYLLPENAVGAEGVIADIESDRAVQLFLTGIPAHILAHYGVNSCFRVVPSSGDREIVLQIRSREGLKASARLLEEPQEREIALQVGQLVREAIRVLPRHLSLTVALDPSLERIERVDATSAFAMIAAVGEAIAAGEKTADCVLSKIRSTNGQIVIASAANPNIPEGYGLLSAGGAALPNIKGGTNEAVKSVIGRWEPQLKQLLAAKWLRLTANEGSSGLAIGAALEIVGKSPQIIMQRDTRRQAFQSDSSSSPTSPPRLPIGTPIQYRLENFSDRPLYCLLLGIDPVGQAIALSPNEQPILPGETRIVPATTDRASGVVEMYLVSAIAPFENSFALVNSSEDTQSDPLEISQALLQDLHNASAVNSDAIGSATDVYALDTKAWATLGFIYQVDLVS